MHSVYLYHLEVSWSYKVLTLNPYQTNQMERRVVYERVILDHPKATSGAAALPYLTRQGALLVKSAFDPDVRGNNEGILFYKNNETNTELWCTLRLT